MFKVVQISDCHLFADINKTSYGHTNPFETLHQVLVLLAQQKANLVLLTGDVSGDLSADSYQHFLSLWNATNNSAELAVIPGNHDDPQLLDDIFGHQILSASPAINGACWQLHGLNSHYRGTLGKVTEHDLQQLEIAVQYSPDMHHLVAVHHHPIATGGWMDKHEWLNAGQFMALVKRYPQIKVVLNGHVHMETDHLIDGCRFLSCPSTCWQFANSKEFAVSEERPGFRVLDLADDGQVDSHIIRI